MGGGAAAASADGPGPVPAAASPGSGRLRLLSGSSGESSAEPRFSGSTSGGGHGPVMGGSGGRLAYRSSSSTRDTCWRTSKLKLPPPVRDGSTVFYCHGGSRGSQVAIYDTVARVTSMWTWHAMCMECFQGVSRGHGARSLLLCKECPMFMKN